MSLVVCFPVSLFSNEVYWGEIDNQYKSKKQNPGPDRQKIKNPANQPGFDVWYENVVQLKAQPEQEGDADYQHGAAGQQV